MSYIHLIKLILQNLKTYGIPDGSPTAEAMVLETIKCEFESHSSDKCSDTPNGREGHNKNGMM